MHNSELSIQASSDRQPLVERQMSEMGAIVCQMEECLSSLRSRLSPVLFDTDTVKESPENPTHQVEGCELGNQLRSNVCRLKSILQEIQHIESCVDV